MNNSKHISDDRIRQSFKWQKSDPKTAQRLKMDVDEYKRRKALIKEQDRISQEVETANYIEVLQTKIVENYNLTSGTGNLTGLVSDRPLTPEEIEQKYSIDKTKWRLSTYWNKEQSNGSYLVSANVTQIKSIDKDPEVIQKVFVDFLSTYKPKSSPHKPLLNKSAKSSIALILPQQDQHFNKFSINGDNSITSRFESIYKSAENIIKKASVTSQIDEVIYVIGSDSINSEWTNNTTKGTPQQNILTYEGAFTLICDHEISMINLLGQNSGKVTVKFVPGNHDRYVGWHLVSWLSAYFSNCKNITFDTSIQTRKYVQYGNTAIMLNHGDVMKPSDLVSIFPIEYKDKWSTCEHYAIMVGDKHHEKSQDYNGIKFYQVPQLSKAQSFWDNQMGYTGCKAEMTAFEVTKTNGISTIYKEIL